MANVRPQNRALIEERIGKARLEAMIDAAVDLIAPDPAARRRCRDQVTVRIEVLPLFLRLREQPTPAQDRQQLRALSRALYQVRTAMRDLSSNMAFTVSDGRKDEFLAVIARAEQMANIMADGLVVPRRGQHRDPVMVQAAVDAYRLITEFGAKAPTGTRNGPYHKLAALLFEVVTGEQANVRKACDFVAEHDGDVIGKTGNEAYWTSKGRI